MFDLREARHQSWGVTLYRDAASNREMTVVLVLQPKNFGGSHCQISFNGNNHRCRQSNKILYD